MTSDLERASAHFAAIVSSSEDAIISKTLEGIVTSWNRGAERLFGYTAEEMIGQPILKLIPSQLQHEEAMILGKLRAGERIERYETLRQHKDGHPLEISLTVSPVRDAHGNIVGAAKIAHDITARKRIERALAEEAHALETLNRIGKAVASESELERIVQIVTDAATEVTGAAFSAFFYNVVEASQKSYWLYALSGVPREAFANFPMPRATEVFGPTFRGEGVVRSDDVRKDARYGKNTPYSGMPPGHLPVCSYLAVPVISRKGEVIGGLFLGHPQPAVFTERHEHLMLGISSQAAIAIDNARLIQTLRDREAELKSLAAERQEFLQSERHARAEAERLGHMKDEFLATLSHELRTPLNAIQGWSTLLTERPVGPEDMKKGLEAIARNVRVQGQIVNDLLDMSRIISGKVHIDVQQIILHDIIGAAVESIRPSAAAKRIRIQPILDSSIGFVRGDPNRLQQVLWNLLTNAVKFTPQGGRVQIILERVNSHVEIVVEDSGIGIKPDFLPFVFDRFRQGDPSASRRFGGLGLGLSIVKSLVELHGGSVRVKSPGENMGSSFIVVLPISHIQRDDPASALGFDATLDPLSSIALPDLNGVEVLIVDDEPDGRALLAFILESQGARTQAAQNGLEALEHLGQRRFDIVLSDIGMPDMDGYAFVREARKLDSGRDSPLPAIAVTAYARPEDRQRSLLAGYQMHLSKPLEARELIAAVASLLHRR